MAAINRDHWSLDYDLAEGGIVLGALKHDSFSLASDVRVTRVWVGTEPPARAGASDLVDFKLGGAALPAAGGVTVLQPQPPAPAGSTASAVHTVLGRPWPSDLMSPSSMFNVFMNLFGLSAEYKSKDPLLKGSPNECTLAIRQRHLFGEYGKNPPHEPGAVLDAARFFPLLTFSLPAVKDRSKPYPKYFRADYRIDVALDDIEESALGSAPPAGTKNVMNKGAIFRDNENTPGAIDAATTALQVAGSIVFSGPSVRSLFAALEKPLKYEVATRGLVEGDLSGWAKLDTWDNVHIWPAKRESGNNPISTPGAFHALHCHWRWGAVSGDTALSTPEKKILPAAGWSQFQGLGWSKAAGGPLIDAAIPRQNLSLAVTKNDAVEWRKEANPSARTFEKLFSDVRSVPAVIEKGDDLVLWFSYEVFRDDAALDKPWSGTLFVNGMYFAHNKDATPTLVSVAGGMGEASNPTPKGIWPRRAR